MSWDTDREIDLAVAGRLYLFCTPCDWEFGAGFTVPSRGSRMPGLVTIRPMSLSVMFGPWTVHWEARGRADVHTN